jgi:hypothetical protein
MAKVNTVQALCTYSSINLLRWSREIGQGFKLGLLLRRTDRNDGQTEAVFGGRWRPHRIATLFGEVRVRLPRLACAGCGCDETGISQPSHCRSTPELDQLQPSLACSVAPLSALMPYRVAADVLQYLLPIDVGKSPETLRRHTLQVGKQLNDAAAEKPSIAAAAITMSLDSTFLRSCEDGGRHLEVHVGNIETETGGRQVSAPSPGQTPKSPC